MLMIEVKEKYYEYIATGIREYIRETNLDIPENTVIVCQTYSPLAEWDTILGFPVYKADMETSFEFIFAYPSDDTSKFSKYFREYMELNDLIWDR